jgi:hypothetical protein
MSFSSSTARSNLQRAQFGGTYWIEYDSTNQYYRVVQGSKADYDSNFGAVVYQESYGKMSKDGSSIENGVDRLLKNFGGVAFVNQVRNQVGDAIILGKFVPDATIQGYTSTYWTTRPNTAPIPPANTTPTSTQVQQQWQAALDDVTIGKNRKDAANLQVNTKTLKPVAATLTYPIGLDRNIQDTLQIDIFKYEPARGLPTIDGATDNQRFLRTGLAKKKKPITMITIPIPNAVGDSNAVQWGGGEFSSVAGTLGNEINNAIFGSIQNTRQGAFNTFEDISTALGGATAGAMRGAGDLISNPYVQRKVLLENLAKAAGAFGINVDVAQVITRTGGVIENPNLELLFTGPSLRSFQFTVRFTPRSAPESVIVRKIIRALKQHSAVKKGVTLGNFQSAGAFSNQNLLLGTPDVFTLKYMKAGRTNEEIKGLTKMKTCALTNLSVDYTGEAGRWAAYDGDSQPVTTLVTMNFAELAPIYDTDYISNFNDQLDDVGF